MAKALAFRRDTSTVVTIDTINNVVADVGIAIPGALTTTVFPGRTRNNIAVYNGDPYLLYIHSSGEARVAVYQSGSWSDVPSAAFPPVSGTVVPISLEVVQDYLVMSVWRQNSASVDGLIVKRTADGSTWDAPVALGAPVQPTVSEGCASIAWRQVMWYATASGIAYYNPITNTMSAAFDDGDDGNLDGPEVPVGSFAFWNNNLYVLKPGTALSLYQLDTAWQPTAPTAPPSWTKLSATGIPSLGSLTIVPDTPPALLFVNRVDELCILYSAALGSKLVKTDAAAFPVFAFTDVTTSLLPSAIQGISDGGFTLYQDDRRRVNEVQNILIHSSSTTQLATWDGVSEINVRTTFSHRVMPPDERFGALRTFTNLQPTTSITGVAQPWDGRVVIDYDVRDASSRPVDIFGEYSVDGDEWSPMTQGDGDDGNEQLATTPAGSSYQFYWDAWADLTGTYPNMNMRIVSRISGV